MNILIERNMQSYTPEADAYKLYLERLGWSVDFKQQVNKKYNIVIKYTGFDFFFKDQYTNDTVIIHEYLSLSVGCCARLKNFIKKIFNRKPDGRIFLNSTVSAGFNFKDEVPCIFRDMGVDEEFFSKDLDSNFTKKYDVVYCGAFKGRQGLKEIITKLLGSAFSVLIIGEVSLEDRNYLSTYGNVTFTGRLSRQEIPEYYRLAKFGLNFTPDSYPLNVQTSTKTLEYYASGLGVISNKYLWISNFVLKHNLDIIWLDQLKEVKDLQELNIQKKNLETYKWETILAESGLNHFLLKMLEIKKNV
jgi:hypothetical protein